LRAFVGEGIAAIPRVEISEAAAPATKATEKARLLIVIISLPLTGQAVISFSYVTVAMIDPPAG